MLTEFYKNVLKLLTSISIAQLIPIIITPILTQYFSPEDFGLYGLYISICTILGGVASCKYDTAIMLPKKTHDAYNTLVLSILITFLFSTFCLSLLSTFNQQLFEITNSELLKKYYYIIPLTIFLISINQALIVWFNRKKKYILIGKQNLFKSTSNSGSSVILGIKSVYLGLIISHLISLIIVSYWNITNFIKDFKKHKIDQKNIKKNFIKYIDFLKFSTISNLFNSVSNIGMTSLIIIFFGPKIAGLYFFAERLIAIPISFVTSSVSHVYFERASTLFHSDRKKLITLTNTVQKNIFILLLPFLLMLTFLGEELFSLFGGEWKEAGVILKYFLVFILFKNIYSPISHIGDILNKQRVLLFFNISLFFFQLSSFYFLKEYNDIEPALLTASCFGAIHYIVLNMYMKKELLKSL
ncbi:MAG: hypothetical protein CMD26_03135 [Flavobacteriales bacterium]|nr:hypothetical protein [Flavobacteriales bacterium]|tara:strand:+ start:9167 stop:10405 length:1239 start_codon:yes stop_codon:yes gene_type:complete